MEIETLLDEWIQTDAGKASLQRERDEYQVRNSQRSWHAEPPVYFDEYDVVMNMLERRGRQ